MDQFVVGTAFVNREDGIPTAPVYYRDTRQDEGRDKFSSIFIAVRLPREATLYKTVTDALRWRNEFVPNAIVYRV